MARRGLSAGMSGREKALGGAVLALYLAVLPYVSGPALDLLERLLGTRLGESVRNAIYYYVVFALVVIVFWGYLGRTTRAFLDRPGGVLASAGLGLVAFYGLNEICGRLLGLVLGLASRDQMTAGLYGTPILLLCLVPMFAPMMMGIACGSLMRPALTNPMVMTVVALELWSTAVATAPASTPSTGFFVMAPKMERIRSPAASCRFELIIFIP